ncbi:MAG TPA: PKD domain-containing protein, partial [Bacteroidia bacterium]|nr:PKD domain-containing protein [Bacteroidia bacterium]
MKTTFRLFLLLSLLYFIPQARAQMAVTPAFTVANQSLCLSAGEAVFTNTSTGALATVAKWAWDFGDGVHVLINPSVMGVNHVFAIAGDYLITLQAYDINNVVIGNYQKYISIFPASACSTQCPTADFIFPAALCNVLRVSFLNTTFFPTGSTAGATYSWNFGDPSSGGSNLSALASPFHTFTSATGHYTVTLTVTGPNSCVSSVQKVVSFGNPVLPPGASFTVTPQTMFINTTVTCLYTGPLNYAFYSIDFGDGSPVLTTPNFLPTAGVTHTYTHYGNPTVTFTFGQAPNPAAAQCTGHISVPLHVREMPPHPCDDCLGSFRPEPGKQYLVSAWTKEENASPTKTSYTFPSLVLTFTGGPPSPALT